MEKCCGTVIGKKDKKCVIKEDKKCKRTSHWHLKTIGNLFRRRKAWISIRDYKVSKYNIAGNRDDVNINECLSSLCGNVSQKFSALTWGSYINDIPVKVGGWGWGVCEGLRVSHPYDIHTIKASISKNFLLWFWFVFSRFLDMRGNLGNVKEKPSFLLSTDRWNPTILV